MLYASTDNLRCFECGHLGHKRFSCPQKNVDNEQLVSVESTENGSFKDNDVAKFVGRKEADRVGS